MEFVRLGNSDIEVSRFGIGALDFGQKINEGDARLIIDAAFDEGINLIDTADSYGVLHPKEGGGSPGASEAIIGNILQGRRDRAVISTKFWNPKGHTAQHIRSAVEASLRRLRTDYIDIYQPHHPCRTVPAEEVIGTLNSLVDEGKIRAYGLSNHWAWQAARVHSICNQNNWHKPVALECCYNLLNRSIENEIVPCAEWLNMGLLVYGALSRGLLCGKYLQGNHNENDPDAWYHTAAKASAWKVLSPENLGVIRELDEIARAYVPETSVWGLAFAWLLSKPHVSSIILGGSRAGQFRHAFRHVIDFEPSPEALAVADYLTREFRDKPYENQFVPEIA